MGGKIPIYEFECDKKVYYPYEIEETRNEKSMLGLTLKDLKLKKEPLLVLIIILIIVTILI